MKCIYSRCKKEIPDGSGFCPWCGRKQKHETRKKRRRTNGTGSVYKLKTGQRKKPWIATKNGKTIGGYFATEREALDALAAFEMVEDVELYNLTVAGVFERWGETAFKDCRKSFKNDYTNAWKHFPENLRCMRFREVKSADVQAVIDSLYDNGKSTSVQNKVKSLYAFLCKFAMSNDIINKNYSSFLKVHKTERKRDDTVFSEAEVDVIAAAASGAASEWEVQTARIIMIYLFTTMRLSELLPLPCSAVHLEGEYPYLIGGEKTEADRNRVVPVISTIRPYVQWFLDHATGEMLFSGYTGNKDPKNWREREYYPLLDKLGVARHTVHGTRRSTVTMSVKAKVDPAALQKIGGWMEFDTIQKHYNKPDVEYLYTELEKLESARQKRTSERNST